MVCHFGRCETVERLLIAGAYDRDGTEHTGIAGALTHAIARNHAAITTLLFEPIFGPIFEEQSIALLVA